MNHQLIERLVEFTDEDIQGLCDVLVDCVEGGASVGFMFPITRDRAVEFWSRVAQAVAAGKRALLVARGSMNVSTGSEWVTFPITHSCPMAHRVAQPVTTAI